MTAWITLLTSSHASQNSIGDVLFILFVFVGILVLAYMTTRYYGKFQQKKSVASQMRVIETISVGPNKYLQLVQVGKQAFVISLTKDHVTFLTEIDRTILDELPSRGLPSSDGSMKLFAHFLNLEKAKKMESSTDEETHSSHSKE